MKNKPNKVSSIYSNDWLHAKCIEPSKRKHGDIRPEWKIHRFPIKGGISQYEAWMLDLNKPNPLLKLDKIP